MPGIDIFSEDFTANKTRPAEMDADPDSWILTGAGGEQIVYRYADWSNILKRGDVYRSPLDESGLEGLREVFPNLYWFFSNTTSESSVIVEDDTHKSFRRYFNVAFSPQGVQHWFESIECQAEDYVARLFDKRGEFDLLEHFSLLPTTIAFDIFGLESNPERIREVQQVFSRYVASYTPAYNPNVDPMYVQQAMVEGDKSIGYFRENMAEELQNPNKEVGYAKIFEQANREARFSGDEMLSNFVTLFSGSADTVAITICLILKTLSEKPDVFDQLEAADALEREDVLDNAAWELMRYDNALQGTIRFPEEDIKYRDRVFEKGRMIFLAAPLIDLDQNYFADPYRIDIGRDNSDKIASFGLGAHACLGKRLAHKEIKEILRNILRLRPDGWNLKVTGSAWNPNHYIVRILTSMTAQVN